MTLRNIPLSVLRPPRKNPRHQLDKAAIAGLAESIKTDGLLQNLVVEAEAQGKFRVLSGQRRFLALKLLRRQGVIDDDFKVPVEIRRNLDPGDALRIATIENVQRTALDPIDEAEAFAAMLQRGASLEDVAAKSGLSTATIRRRLALADLCDEVKAAVRTGELVLSVAEALTLATAEQQCSLLAEIRDGADLDRDMIREMLLGEKPSVAIAIFPLERYTGTFTRDLFGDDETTLFDDVEQFMALQREAVEALVEKHRKKAAWVDVFNVYSVSWWQYRQAEKGEPAGVVINLMPTGRVEIEKGLARHTVTPEVVEEMRNAPAARTERPVVTAALVRYVAIQKSMAVQAALLANPRKLKEVVALCLLAAFKPGGRVRIEPHPCLVECASLGSPPTALSIVRTELLRLLTAAGMAPEKQTSVSDALRSEMPTPLELYQGVRNLSDQDLDRLNEILVVLSSGQTRIDVLDTEERLFDQIAIDLGVEMRGWWTPDAEFLSLLRKDQLACVATESGATRHLGSLSGYTKKSIVDALARYFERTADLAAGADKGDLKGKAWLPGTMAFPSRTAVTVTDPA